MRELLVVHRENDAFAVLVRDHVIHVDQPYSAGGMDVGPTPLELFVASLAASAAHYARRYLSRHGLPAAGLEITAGYTMSPTVPTRVSHVDLRVRPPARLSAVEVDGLVAAVDRCTVHNSIIEAPRIGVHLASEARAA